MSNSPSALGQSRSADAALDVRPITPAIGAEIHGVLLSGKLPAETVTAIRGALLRHRVVARSFRTRPCRRSLAPRRSSTLTARTPGRANGTRT